MPLQRTFEPIWGGRTYFYPMSVIQQRVSFGKRIKIRGICIKIPTGASQWIDSATEEYRNAWGAGSSKGLHDPCPVGWRIANTANYRQLFTSGGTGSSED